MKQFADDSFTYLNHTDMDVEVKIIDMLPVERCQCPQEISQFMSLSPIFPLQGRTLQAYEINENIGYLVSRVQSLMNHMVTQRTLAELSITGTQASMLFMLAIGRCSTAAELAREYGIDASAVTRLLDRMEKRGLLSRIRSDQDRRVVWLELTESGRELAERIPQIFASALERAVKGFTPEEVGFLKSMLRRVHANCSDEAHEITPRYK